MNKTIYKNYLLVVLLVIQAFNYVDRLALGLLLQDIKKDLNLSDTQLGLLTGIAFALFYSVMGIPMARWADKGNRIFIVSLTTALWSIAVILSGTAGTFLHLLLIRVGVAVGEAGCIPPAHSLIPDYFSRSERPRAVSIYMLGATLATLIGYFGAGWLNEFVGWRLTFMALGLPGVILAMIAWFTLKEPRNDKSLDGRGSAGGGVAIAPVSSRSLSIDEPSLKLVFLTLWRSKTFCHLLFAFSVLAFFNYGIGAWQPAFFVRSYGMQTGEVGTWFTVIYGLGGTLGVYLGGELASRRAANNEAAQLKGMAIVYSTFSIVSAVIYLSPSRSLSLCALAVAAIGGATIGGPLFATVQTLVPARMRAMSIAIIYFFANLIGLGIGPLVVGAISDGIQSIAGEESLRYALAGMCPGYLWFSWHLWMASGTVQADLDVSTKESDEIKAERPIGLISDSIRDV